MIAASKEGRDSPSKVEDYNSHSKPKPLGTDPRLPKSPRISPDKVNLTINSCVSFGIYRASQTIHLTSWVF
eukprot:2737640-Amphidinium_carterae.1